jgi:hypothetical protein
MKNIIKTIVFLIIFTNPIFSSITTNRDNTKVYVDEYNKHITSYTIKTNEIAVDTATCLSISSATATYIDKNLPNINATSILTSSGTIGYFYSNTSFGTANVLNNLVINGNPLGVLPVGAKLTLSNPVDNTTMQLTYYGDSNPFRYLRITTNVYIDEGIVIKGSATITGLVGVSSITFSDGTVITSTTGFGGGSSGGSGVTVATFTLNMSVGGDVYLASMTFCPVIGSIYYVSNSTMYITAIEFYQAIVSTINTVTFNLAYSSSTNGTVTWDYVNTTDISITANNQNSGQIVPNKQNVLYPTYKIALHCRSIPASGTLPSQWGIVIRYWRYLDKDN